MDNLFCEDFCENVCADERAEAEVVSLLSTLFGSVAYMDPETVRTNVLLACDGGFCLDDRTIDCDIAHFLLNDFSLIFIGMIVNKEIRKLILEAVSAEITLDEKDDIFVASIRKEMEYKENNTLNPKYVIDLSSYNEEVYRYINSELSESLDCVSDFYETIDELISCLSDDDKIDIGYIVSNFMYMLRAFAQNGLLIKYLQDVINSVKQELDIP